MKFGKWYNQNYKKHIEKGYVLLIRYEDLVTSPLATAERIFGYLGLELTADIIRFCEKISNETKSTYHAKYQERWYKPDHSQRIGRWHENLDTYEKKEINFLLESLLSELGY